MPMQQEFNISASSIRNTLAVYPAMGPSSAHILHSDDLTTKPVFCSISPSTQLRSHAHNNPEQAAVAASKEVLTCAGADRSVSYPVSVKVSSKLAHHGSASFSSNLKSSDFPSNNGSTTPRAVSADYGYSTRRTSAADSKNETI
nr:hypothetical protein L204_04155 [Cryptococcus depauperatus CBS 7855]